jgi:molybdopterin converting factor small subunit
MANVRIPPVLRQVTDQQTQLEADGASLGEALEQLFERYPDLRERMLDADGQLQRFVNVYVDEEDVRLRGGLDVELKPDSSVVILPAMAGGAR